MIEQVKLEVGGRTQIVLRLCKRWKHSMHKEKKDIVVHQSRHVEA